MSGTGPDSCDHPGTTWYPPPRLVGAANHVVQTDGTLSKCNLPPLRHGKQYPWDRIIVLSRWNWALSPGAFKHPASKVLPCFLKCNSHGRGGDISVNNLVELCAVYSLVTLWFPVLMNLKPDWLPRKHRRLLRLEERLGLV